ncbi:MAG TPA: hypothetical protein VI564_06085 [Candidatus Nanoarchaeia archaeon]|nr:hypothetical protein [Candidatus Nanoarchaeia archaeon]
MQFITYFLVSLISYLGLAAGIALVKIAPEEQKPLGKYLKIFERILLFAIFGFVLFYYFNNIFSFLVLLAYFGFLIFINYRPNEKFKLSMLNYAVLGIVLSLSAKNANLLVIESSLVFLFGIGTSCSLYSQKEKNHFRILFYNLGFLILANSVYLL